MKHLFLRATLCFFLLAGWFTTTNAQILFSEDFDGIGGPTAGGAGTYSFPAGWLKFNVDARTPAASVSYVNEAWERREDFANAVTDSAAFSTSWYTPAGAADDWMWTPAIALGANPVLTWNAITYDPSYPDGYQLRIKTGAAPTLANQATSATAFSIVAENTVWTARTQSLAAYANQTVYIGYRNNSNDEFLLLIDDVVVENQIPFNAFMQSTVPLSEYTIIPTPQATALPLSGTIRNNGTSALTNVFMTVNVYDGAAGLVYTANSPTTASLAVAGSVNLTAASFTPSAPDVYTMEYIARHANLDGIPTNDTLYSGIIIDDSTYARDNGTVTGTLGIGGGGGILGQMFKLNVTDQLTSMLCYIGNGSHNMDNQPIYGEVWAYNNGEPTTLIARTDTFICDTAVGQVITLMMDGGPLTLPVDSFWIGIVEGDSNITLGTATSIFTQNTTNVDFPYGTGAWENNEFYGFNVSYVLRANFGDFCAGYSVTDTINDAACGQSDGNVTAIPVGGHGPFDYLWSNGGTSASIASVAAGTYTVTVTDDYGCVFVDTAIVGNLGGPVIDSVTVINAACNGDNGTISILVSGGSPNYSYAWSNGVTAATNTDVAGSYSVTVTDQNGCIITSSATITEPTALTATLTSTDESSAGASDGTAGSTPLGGTTPYSYLWSNGATTQNITNLGPGTYCVTITDANGCTFTDCADVILGVTNSVNQIVVVDVFPNPNNGNFSLTVQLPVSGDVAIEVLDLAGKIVYSENVENVLNLTREISLGDLASGSYLLKVSTGDLVKVRRISVNK